MGNFIANVKKVISGDVFLYIDVYKRQLFKRLLTMLDDVDDVQNVYHNVSNVNEE